MSDCTGSQGSPFLRLTAEIRNQIYTYLFRSEHHISGEYVLMPDKLQLRPANNDKYFPANMHDVLPLLRTCQQVHQEAMAILYGVNKFYFNDQCFEPEVQNLPTADIYRQWSDITTLYRFLRDVGGRNRSTIQLLNMELFTANFPTRPHSLTASHAQLHVKEGNGVGFVGHTADLLSHRSNLVQIYMTREDSRQRLLARFLMKREEDGMLSAQTSPR